MACPWFEPVTPAGTYLRPQPARAPLGAVFSGFCHAGGERTIPAEEVLWEACNFGYGRERCDRFPPETEADAVRFTEYCGKLLWILEKDFRPAEFGVVTADSPTGNLARQAEAFRKACLPAT